MLENAIFWFRQDLRLSDNPGLYAAARAGHVFPIYIQDDVNAGDARMGEASRWWLHHSLISLNKSLAGKLNCYAGDPLKLIPELIKKFDVKAIFWNRCYEPWQIQRDKKLKQMLQEAGIDVNSYNGSLLWEPWEIKNQQGEPYKVFTPFYKKGCLNANPPHEPFAKPKKAIFEKDPEAGDVAMLDLLPKIHWYDGLEKTWHIGEEAAHERLHEFIDNGLAHYKAGRNYPAKAFVSRLSPYLHWGEISPHQIWYHPDLNEPALGEENVSHFRSELGWREFSYSLLYFYPDLPKANLQKKFDAFPWVENKKDLKKWQKGLTGYPIVDAGMRELWQTGYMHNRVRMIVASFLVKNLRIHWRFGAAWFWDCLVDADLANNSASWQWVAGCGADAAPYFRIFNPVIQAKKFDPDGTYIRQYVPELKQLPLKFIYAPWEAPEATLKDAGIQLGKTYPSPIVDLMSSREEALAAYEMLRASE